MASVLPGLTCFVIRDGNKLAVDGYLAGFVEGGGTVGAEGVHFGVHAGVL
jgi:hypothetical protein